MVLLNQSTVSRIANMAASLVKLSRWAPEKPKVARAMSSRSTAGSSGLLRVWIARILQRPQRSGKSTWTCRSNRPGRRTAGSSRSGRLVAPINRMRGSRFWVSPSFPPAVDWGLIVFHVSAVTAPFGRQHFHFINKDNGTFFI